MEQTTADAFGDVLRSFRKRRRLTQKALADLLGVHRNTIHFWESGNFLPESKTMMLELARHLDLNEQETRLLLEASLTSLAPYWYVPFPRNPFFTGREEILQSLHQQLCAHQTVALTQSYALHGLGGIGKTHLSIEYAYRHALEYTAVFWIDAENVERIIASFLAIAERLQLPGDQHDHQQIVAAVQRWLLMHSKWLLIWDNVENLELVQRFLPAARQGAILLTTRRRALGTLAQGLELPTMTPEEGILFLLRRAGFLSAEVGDVPAHQLMQQMPSAYAAAQKLVAEMDGLPLALDQVGAYIEETPCRLEDYLDLYQSRRAALLDRRGETAVDHPASVVATWSLSFEQVEHTNAAAADVLRLCAFLHPDAIPEELFLQGGDQLGERLGPVGVDVFELHAVFRTIAAYSLLKRNVEERTLSIHRLVQAVLQDSMNEQERDLWQQRAIQALNAVFPEVTYKSTPDVWKQAERLVLHVLALAPSLSEQSGSQETAAVLQKAASYLTQRAQYGQVEALYQQALRIRKQILGPEHPDTARTLNSLATLFFRQGKYEQAEAWYRQALSMQEQALGPDHPQVGSTLYGLAYTLFEQGKYEHVEALYQRSLRIREQALGPEHPEVAGTLNNLALFYYEQGKYEQAEPLYQRSLSLQEQVLGPEHNQVAYPLNNLALLYYEQGKYEQAQSYCLRALSILEQALGPEHLRLIFPQNNLARVYVKQNRYEEAEQLYQRALHILEQAVEADHPDVAGTLDNLAYLYMEQRRYEEAEQLYRRVLHIWGRALGSEHVYLAFPLDGLARLCTEQGRYEEAKQLYQQSLSIRKQKQEPDHPYVAFSLNGLANLYREQGNYEKALPLYERALSIREQRLGQGHPETAQTLHDFATCFQMQGKLDKAASLYKRALSIRRVSLGNTHPKTIATQRQYARLKALAE
ncbi:MAG TPA: FxSxx-COOH system tetratricopeptide repeat protein [Ktedonobacteraceae bacterium]|nr:FxSxx-COOH system tetratricopeptide repeat protein [Ktedonobacteraceae bacterium]